MITIGSYEELASWIGKEMGQSGCVTFDQERINKFADATLDHQWIHTDPERCKTESRWPYCLICGTRSWRCTTSSA